MQMLGTNDPTTLCYWLNWIVLLCAISVLGSMVIASLVIWKYEHSHDSESDVIRKRQDGSYIVHCDVSWKPALKQIHPIFLMLFRIIAFSLLVIALSFHVAIHGSELFYYYTQWTFTLVSIYFLVGSFLSVRGCYYYPKKNCTLRFDSSDDTEKGLHMPLAHEIDQSEVKSSDRVKVNHPSFVKVLASSGFWDFLFHVLDQMCAGAVTLTDVLYWTVIFPFLNIKDYEMSFLTVLAHSLNLILLLGDTALNSLQLHWYGISYFILWTGTYVIFQWVVHACVDIWWPYPFLDLSAPYSPLWYLMVAVLHEPCYAIFVMVVRAKYLILTRWLLSS